MAARRDRPDHVGRISYVNVVVDDHHELSAVGSGAGAGSDEQSLLGMPCVTLLDRNDGKRTRLAAVDKTPDAFDLGNTGFFQLFPQCGRPKRNREITSGRLEGRRAENNRIIPITDALYDHNGSLAHVCLGEISGPFAEGSLFRHLFILHWRQLAFENDLSIGRDR